MVLRHKKLFQCPDAFVALAGSQTNCHSYKVWVHGCLFVVASNSWSEELESLKASDKERLVPNSVHVLAKRPYVSSHTVMESESLCSASLPPIASQCEPFAHCRALCNM